MSPCLRFPFKKKKLVIKIICSTVRVVGQLWLPKARDPIRIINVQLQQLHDLCIVFRGRWLNARCPIVEVPIVAHAIDKLVVERRLMGIEILQIFVRKCA